MVGLDNKSVGDALCLQAAVCHAQLRFVGNGKNYHMHVWWVSLASSACCVGYLGGDHPNREVSTDNDVLSKWIGLGGLTVNGSCIYYGVAWPSCQLSLAILSVGPQ